MLLWTIFAIMTAALLAAVLRPLLRANAEPVAESDTALASVYASQLAEIDADLDRGAVTADEAAGLRAEVGRRLLAHSQPVSDGEHDAPSGNAAKSHNVSVSGPLALTVGALVPVLAVGGYLIVGSPLLPSKPHTTRVHQDSNGVRVAELVRRVEARLAKHPEDGRGWDVIAPVYMRAQRFEDAAQAWRNATRLLGETPTRVLGLAEAEVFSGNGIVSEAARKALVRGVALEPDYLPAQFWLAIARKQDGKLVEARRELAALLEKAGATTPLGRTITDHLQDIDARLRPAQGDTSSPIADADQRAMIEGMVSGLASRLEEDGSDFEGWRRLIRSYVVLRRPADARRAMTRARLQFKNEPARQIALDKIAKEFNLVAQTTEPKTQ